MPWCRSTRWCRKSNEMEGGHGLNATRSGSGSIGRVEGKPETFTFLGFTCFCGQLTNGIFIVWRITAKKRMVAKLKAIEAALGHDRYHAVLGNSTQLRIFSRRVCWLWRSVLVRRSQRAQVRWDRLSPLLIRWIPQPRILHPYPDAHFAATHPG